MTIETLHLPLKAKWYDMIESGEKPEEYREKKPYWIKRIMKCLKWCSIGVIQSDNLVERIKRCADCVNVSNFTKISGGYTRVQFSYGYTKRRMTWEIKGISISYGNPEWGAPKDKEVFIIKLGRRIDK